MGNGLRENQACCYFELFNVGQYQYDGLKRVDMYLKNYGESYLHIYLCIYVHAMLTNQTSKIKVEEGATIIT